jgi:DNA-binding GntR family transcriptional regulator
MMPKLEYQTLNDRAYAALKKCLMSGHFKPGQVLTIRGLADEYGISPTPIREALQRLIAERSLELLRNRSIGVPCLTGEKLAELKRIRCVLEGLAGELAAPNLVVADISRLSQLIQAIDTDIDANNIAGYLRHNEKFHSLIYERARSPILLRIIQDLWTQVGPFLNGLFEDACYLRRANVGHRKILAAIRRGDTAAVRRSIVWDISEAAASLMRRFQGMDVEARPSVGASTPPARPRRNGRIATV